MSEGKKIARRDFVAKAVAASAGVTIIPRHVLGKGLTPPSDLLNIAGVGIGGMGRQNLINMSSQNIVALCDVDWGYADKGFESLGRQMEGLQKRIDSPDPEPQTGTRPFDRDAAKRRLADMQRLKDVHLPNAKRYTDFREMLSKQKDIDAVLVATADHMHAPIAAAAMELGKHVYVQKPLTWSVAESRQLARLAKEKKVATQMGNQGHSLDDARTAVEYVWAGAIGEIREVHIWTNRPLGFWPQGIPRPAQLSEPADTLRWNGAGIDKRLAAAELGSGYSVPDKLTWDLFLGVAPKIDYHPIYHPFNWRGWVDWGMGPVGDMGAHLIDHSMWALSLGYPTTVETISTPFNNASYPSATNIYYEFPAREVAGKKLPPVKLTWYDGGMKPPKPEEMGEEELSGEGGALLIGSKGKLLHETYGANPRLLPKSLHDSFGKPAQKLPRIPNQHHELNWVDAAKGKTEASCPFEYAARLTEVMLLGVVALRAGKKINYDGENMRVTNVAAANDFLKRDYRTGW